jgi:hypothetical protein
MTVQLSKAQLDAIKVELAKVGLSVTVARKPKSIASEVDARIARLRKMTFKTASIKGEMMRTLARIKKEGSSNEKFGFSEFDYPPMGKRWDCLNNAYNWRSGRKLLTHQPS